MSRSARNLFRTLLFVFVGLCVGSALLEHVANPTRRIELQSLFQEVMNSGKAQDNYFHDAEGRHWAILRAGTRIQTSRSVREVEERWKSA